MSSSPRFRWLAAPVLAIALTASAVATTPAPGSADPPKSAGTSGEAAAPSKLPPPGPDLSAPAKPPKAVPAKKPARPAAPTAARKGGTALVRWQPPADGGSAITGYVVTPFVDGRAGRKVSFDASTTTRKLSKLPRRGRLAFTVAARNSVGTGPASRRSEPVQIMAAPSAPAIVAVTAGDVYAVLSWDLPDSDGGSPIVNYVVTPYVDGVPQPAQVFGPETTATVTGLSPDTTYRFRVAARNADGTGPQSEPSSEVTARVSPTLSFAGAQPKVGVAYTANVSVEHGNTPYTFAVASGALPPGLALNPATGTISGVPSAGGNYRLVVRVTDSRGNTGSLLIVLAVVPAPIIAVPQSALGEVGASYTLPFTVSGGTGPYRWSIASGGLPPGLSLDPGSGLLSGRPTAAGTFGFEIQVRDAFGLTDTEPLQIQVQQTSIVALNASATLTTFATPVTLTVDIGPGQVGGTLTVFDGRPNGIVTQLLTYPIDFNRATFDVQVPSLGVNRLQVQYNSSVTGAVVYSNILDVAVRAVAGQLVIDQFRQSGIGGLRDQFVVLYNLTSIPFPIEDVRVEAGNGVSVTVPFRTLPLAPRGGYLIAANRYSVSTIVPDQVVPDLGQGGLRLIAPDVPGTRLDAAGPLPGFSTGTPLPAFTSPPFVRNAWVRLRDNGVAQDTGDNRTDFRLVATVMGPINGVPSALGTPAPLRLTGPVQHNGLLQSTLLDPGVRGSVAPNRQIVPGAGSDPDRLIIRRVITNRASVPITQVAVRITSLSQENGAPPPGGIPTPPDHAYLRLVNPTTATSTLTLSSGRSVTVNNLRMDYPTEDPPGGGLATTLTLPLPVSGLSPGESVNVSLTFEIDRTGPFWIAYNMNGIVNAPSGTDAGARTGKAAKHDRSGKSQKSRNVDTGTLR